MCKSEWENKSLDEFIEMVSPEINKRMNKNNLSNKVIKLACSFLRIKFENNELNKSVKREVEQAIDESLIYHVNVLGEDI